VGCMANSLVKLPAQRAAEATRCANFVLQVNYIVPTSGPIPVSTLLTKL
jgi:hypothetical protein